MTEICRIVITRHITDTDADLVTQVDQQQGDDQGELDLVEALGTLLHAVFIVWETHSSRQGGDP